MKSFRMYWLMLFLPLFGLWVGGCGDPNSFEDSLEIIKKKANAEDPYYMAVYAEVLRRGEYGVTIDKDAALEWAKKSSAKEHPLGLYNLRVIEEDDSIIPKFLEGLKELAANGSPRAQFNLGVMYRNGQGVPQDDKEAVKWHRKAAEQGYARAQSNLGYMYESGQGVPKDEKEAVEWYRKAADQGHAPAQSNLGVMYFYGGGVQDYKEAVKWFRKAAEQGNVIAQFYLGEMYRKGDGVPKDYVQAYAWWNLAAANGREKAKTNLDIIEAKMTPEQIAKAQALSNELQQKIEANK